MYTIQSGDFSECCFPVKSLSLGAGTRYCIFKDGKDAEFFGLQISLSKRNDQKLTVEPLRIRWNQLSFQRSNQSYEMVIGPCYYVLKGLLLTPEKGQYKMASFLDDQLMCRLYEKFVLQYYRTHYSFLSLSAPQVKWNVDDDIRDGLPVMQTDIMLKQKGKILIIDTKYYSHTMQDKYRKNTLHSNNLYQIFAYVKNQDVENTGNVAGLLLYAKTNESITPDHNFLMSKNPISVKTLDQVAAAYFTEKK